MYQLPGSMPPVSNLPRRSLMPRLSTLIIVWVVVAGGYGIYHFYGKQRQVAAAAPVAATQLAASLVPGKLQDFSRHLDESATTLARAQARIQSNEKLLRHLLMQSESNLDKRVLSIGLGNLEAAREDLEQSRQELQFIQNNFKGDNNQ